MGVYGCCIALRDADVAPGVLGRLLPRVVLQDVPVRHVDEAVDRAGDTITATDDLDVATSVLDTEHDTEMPREGLPHVVVYDLLGEGHEVVEGCVR